MDDLPRAGKTASTGASAPIRHDKVRVIAFFYRKQGLSEEEFSTYWRETHSHIFASLAIVKKNLLKYEQLHVHREAQATVKGAGFPLADYDGLAIIDAVSIEKILEVFEDPEYKEKAIPDEENFIDRKKIVAWPAEIVSVFSDPS